MALRTRRIAKKTLWRIEELRRSGKPPRQAEAGRVAKEARAERSAKAAANVAALVEAGAKWRRGAWTLPDGRRVRFGVEGLVLVRAAK